MIMKKAILIFLLSLGGMAVRAQIPQPDPDTTAKHFLIVASIGNLQEISAAHLAVFVDGASAPALAVDDADYAAGATGLIAHGGGAAFDNSRLQSSTP